ncbi:MAG: biotin transporter BioY [Clostridia bacterium]|nr:biotin transporter BioY [Clostridia bacterium]
MRLKIRALCEISIFVSLMTICAWITIPFAIPFTLQTFAFFLCCLCLGGKKAFVCTAVYIFLGIVGVPVFSSFGAGIGAVFGASGGFLIGLLPSALV